MADTKENILITALHLFAKNGYEAVSVSMIAGELGMTKSALYKHYRNKRDIFDSITQRMVQSDSDKAINHDVPDGTLKEMPEVYHRTQPEKIKEFSKDMFIYWTTDSFASDFRKMLTLEQYRNAEMSRLFQQYLVSGPLGYVEDMFFAVTGEKSSARQLAVQFYAPMFFLYSLYDGAKDKESVTSLFKEHVENFIDKEITTKS